MNHFVRLLTGYPIPSVSVELPEISFWRDEYKKLYVHFKSTGFLFNKPDAGWYKKLEEANLPLNHTFFALLDREEDKVVVYMLEDTNEHHIYDWYDMAWFCVENDINLEILDREQCPKETQTGGRYLGTYDPEVSTVDNIPQE